MKHSPNMSRFLLASLCLHAGLALPWVSTFQLAGQRDNVLNVTLTITDRTATTSESLGARSRTHAVPDARAEISESNEAATMQPQSAAPLSHTTDMGRSADDASAASTRVQIQAQLLTDLQRHFEYPMLARRRGWQGTVWLSFLIESDGVLQRIQIARSSGYDNLDSSAVTAMRRVGQLAEAKQLLNGQSLEMSVPVVYRLKDY